VVLPASLPRQKVIIDYLGIILIAAASVCIVLLTSLGGTTYPWASAQIIFLGVASVLLIGGFVWAEGRAAEPVMPLRLFRNEIFVVTSVIGFVVGFAMFGSITYLPLYLQVVKGVSPTESGLRLLPMMAGLLLTSMTSGLLISRWGHYKVFPVVGTAIFTVGLFLLSRMDEQTNTLTSSTYMFVLGAGLGLVRKCRCGPPAARPTSERRTRCPRLAPRWRRSSGLSVCWRAEGAAARSTSGWLHGPGLPSTRRCAGCYSGWARMYRSRSIASAHRSASPSQRSFQLSTGSGRKA
jgi:hypothetical protein